MAIKSLARPRVVVIDDEPAVRNLVRRMLEPAGYVVDEAEDPKQACIAAECDSQIDLLVSDFHMPDITGGEVARRIRAAQPDVKVLFITGHADALFTERESLWDGEAFLEKPFTRQGLLEAASLVLFGCFGQEDRFAAAQPAAAGGV